MPSIEPQIPRQGSDDPAIASASAETADELQFPPVSRDHIINCSYDKWFPKYRSSCVKSVIIPLPDDFISYLREDGILLADDDNGDATDTEEEWHSTPATTQPRPPAQDDSDSDSDDSPPGIPPDRRFPDLHNAITTTIANLGGSVVPKLNWSTPKDATWISPFNTLKCTTANDVYLLLKSSSFVSHDLEHPFDGCVASSSSHPSQSPTFAPVLVLRPHFSIQPSLEFRCFVKDRTLVGVSQRDLNFYDFLRKIEHSLVSRIQSFFDDKLRFTFPDPSFIFDVYVPEDAFAADDLGRVRLVDINPWAPRTDTLLFGWGELLGTNPLIGSVNQDEAAAELPESSSAGETTDEEVDEDIFVPELRLIEKDDPAAFNFSSSLYSAHKLPKEVVDASMAGTGGLAEFAKMWNSATGNMGGDMWQPPKR
ncbi:related to cell cycle progression protein [Cephalotrichum gorgonifer]|uniref:Related to cell cycle progression protein n=1 Tax=Cephalotrichum gorgonifer TaxID=2041049 RepID=A0AAE8N179_9PEZI|nr:related to cell cycle progression protein [Cephalotrichum gorgonifer]